MATIDFSSRKYQVIYVDPPWQYDFVASNSRAIENHYPTMALEEIKALEVPSAKNSVCFMWATTPKLKDAFEVLEAWGFTYKSCLVWDKATIGMGYWFRGQHELLLVGVKGNFSPPQPELRISSVYREKKSEHSKKPLRLRSLIAKWYPDASKLEMFAREHLEGWEVFGNETPTTEQSLLRVERPTQSLLFA